jgi:RimJ/RimL family protein N-acetyltransferase
MMGSAAVDKRFPEVSNGDVRLTDFTVDHLTERYVSWLNDPDVVRYSEQRHRTHTLDSCESYLCEKVYSDDYFLAIEVGAHGPGHHVGNMGISVDVKNSVANLSIMVGAKEYWGSGVGSRAWCLAIHTLFERLDFRLIAAGTMSVNEPMRKLFKRSNMQIDAVLPKRFLWEGQLVDLLVASISSGHHRSRQQES